MDSQISATNETNETNIMIDNMKINNNPVKQEECIELRNMKYKSMLLKRQMQNN